MRGDDRAEGTRPSTTHPRRTPIREPMAPNERAIRQAGGRTRTQTKRRATERQRSDGSRRDKLNQGDGASAAPSVNNSPRATHSQSQAAQNARTIYIQDGRKRGPRNAHPTHTPTPTHTRAARGARGGRWKMGAARCSAAACSSHGGDTTAGKPAGRGGWDHHPCDMGNRNCRDSSTRNRNCRDSSTQVKQLARGSPAGLGRAGRFFAGIGGALASAAVDAPAAALARGRTQRWARCDGGTAAVRRLVVTQPGSIRGPTFSR
jgi:hypothetical protein